MVNTMIIQSGLIADHIKRNGNRDKSIAKIVNAPTKPYARGEFARKMATTNIVVAIIFARGSMRCKNEFPGKYCPIVMLFNMATSF